MALKNKAVSNKTSKSEYFELLEKMILIRLFEDRCSEHYSRGNIKGFLHLYTGEEAIAVGSISCLEKEDYVITHYRDHGHALARGVEAKYAMAELFGKSTGTTGGIGGSMHIFDATKNFAGGHAIVGGQLPIGVGLAYAAKYKNTGAVTLCFLGDGALNEGEFHESMNLAALWDLPIVFICENNLYGMGVPVEEAVAKKDIFEIGHAYDMPCSRVDGMNVLEVKEVTNKIIKDVRNGKGPYFLEAQTYRFRGHSMADPSMYRGSAEEELWKLRDPINLHWSWLKENGYAKNELNQIYEKMNSVMDDAVQFATESEFPTIDDLYKNIYFENVG
ncbi:MAG: pyruvate dehydrogenase (acetyl-transferring) E1 component subunit alpha [SAR202 cluster bacterium]|nr:pyruvate dehydrogenase (acetyl-transferring) E1 component subunit alpha [SAR202 cluster bacterium]